MWAGQRLEEDQGQQQRRWISDSSSIFPAAAGVGAALSVAVGLGAALPVGAVVGPCAVVTGVAAPAECGVAAAACGANPISAL